MSDRKIRFLYKGKLGKKMRPEQGRGYFFDEQGGKASGLYQTAQGYPGYHYFRW
jgi:hypothetical protein